MGDLKTRKNDASVKEFLESIPDERKRRDAKAVARMMREETGAKAKMWGSDIVGYGSYPFEYASGRSGEWFLTGFSPRKQNLTLYVMNGFKTYPALLKRLGRHKTGKACLYIHRLEDVDRDVLRELIRSSVASVAGRSGST